MTTDPGKGDWPMWGGTTDRNMVSNMKGLPTSWEVKSKKNVKWVAELKIGVFPLQHGSSAKLFPMISSTLARPIRVLDHESR